jgi:hypothetical protein
LFREQNLFDQDMGEPLRPASQAPYQQSGYGLSDYLGYANQPAAQPAQPLAQYAQGFGAAPEEQPYQEDQPNQPEPAPQPNGGIGSLLQDGNPYYGGNGLGGNFEELSDWMQYQ